MNQLIFKTTLGLLQKDIITTDILTCVYCDTFNFSKNIIGATYI